MPTTCALWRLVFCFNVKVFSSVCKRKNGTNNAAASTTNNEKNKENNDNNDDNNLCSCYCCLSVSL